MEWRPGELDGHGCVNLYIKYEWDYIRVPTGMFGYDFISGLWGELVDCWRRRKRILYKYYDAQQDPAVVECEWDGPVELCAQEFQPL